MGRIPNETIELVAAANDIVEVIGSYFPLKRMGGAYKALCPFHNERSPSFTVNPQRQMFKCFGCGAGGGVFRFVMDYEHIDFIAAVRKLAEKANIRIEEAEMSSEDFARSDLRRRLLAMHAEAADFFHHQLMRGNSAGEARDYLKKRGLSADVAKSWKIGYAPDTWDGLLSTLQTAGYNGEELKASGLFSQKEESDRFYDRFRGRVMFPICNDTGEVIAFSGRILDAEKSPAKYVNSPETPIFVKGAVLFGLHKSKRALIDKKSAIVCEGQIDLITAFENGVQNVIAPQGTAFTEKQARILKRYVDEVVLCFDADAAGDKAAERSLPYLLGQSLLVRVAEMAPGEDPDTLIRKQGGPAFAALMAQAKDFFEFQIERQARRPDFATPRGKIAAANKLMSFISLIPDVVTSDAVLSHTSMRLGIPENDLKTLIKAPQPYSREADENAVLDAPRAEPIKLDQTLTWLAFLALRDSACRVWLQSRSWDRVLDDSTPATALLVKVFQGEVRPDEPASISAFLTTLEPMEEAALSSVLEYELPAEPRIAAEDCWNELERRQLLRLQQSLRSRLHNPALTPDEQTGIATQILEAQRQLAALPPPRSPRVAV